MGSVRKARVIAGLISLLVCLFSDVVLAAAIGPLGDSFEESAPGTYEFVLPSGIESLTIEGYGGGGGGGGGYYMTKWVLGYPDTSRWPWRWVPGRWESAGCRGGAGGNGAHARSMVPVAEEDWGKVVRIVVGAGGSGGSGGRFPNLEFDPPQGGGDGTATTVSMGGIEVFSAAGGPGGEPAQILPLPVRNGIDAPTYDASQTRGAGGEGGEGADAAGARRGTDGNGGWVRMTWDAGGAARGR